MKKVLRFLLCVFLVLSIGYNLLVLVPHPVSADSGDILAYPCILASPGYSSPLGLSPATIRSVYNLPSTGGNGTIAIVDPYDDPTILADSNVFSNYYGLPPLNNTNFEKHMMSPTINFESDWAEEISADVQWAHAIAPNANILLVEATNDVIVWKNGTEGPMLDAVDYARNQSDVVAVSNVQPLNFNYL